MHVGYIYCHINTTNGKYYIGQTRQTPDERWQQHVSDATKGAQWRFHRAIRKHTPEAFVMSVLARVECDTEEQRKALLNTLEKLWIAATNARHPDVGYNHAPGGTGGPIRKGMKTPDATKAKQIAALRGRKATPEARARMSAARKGERHHFHGKTLWMIDYEKVRAEHLLGNTWWRGRRHTEEAKQKISDARTGKNYGLVGDNHPMAGRKHSAQARRKMSEAAKRRYNKT